MSDCILAFDHGTTSSRSIIFGGGRTISSAQLEYPQIYPQPGWVEHNPLDIWSSQYESAKAAIEKSGLKPEEISAIGITNQRETTILWDRKTGEPVCNAIVWQCRRTSPICDRLRGMGLTDIIRQKTGLVLDAYFSATKLMWLFENVAGLRERAERGELAFGTPDCWLIWKLTGGKSHITDYTNASRTMLFNINTLSWDDELLEIFGIPRSILPQTVPSSGVCAYTDPSLFGASIPIAGIAGDQQASLYGQGCTSPGDLKNTYGTGCFMLMNVGKKPIVTDSGLLTTVCCDADGKPAYALEGSVFSGGCTIQWLRDELQIISSAKESEALARSVENTGGVYLVPAFTGLGAPWWDADARGSLTGITRGTSRAHIVRAALEAIAYQSADLADMMMSYIDSRDNISLRVDGGACANSFLMQFQSDICGFAIRRSSMLETTAYGAACLAARAVGADITLSEGSTTVFRPAMDAEQRAALLDGWHRAVHRTLTDRN